MQRGADKLRARCFMKQHASRDARVPGSLAAQPRPASVAPSAGGTTASRPDRPTPRDSSVCPWGRVHPRDGRTTRPYGVRHLHGCATYRPTLPMFLCASCLPSFAPGVAPLRGSTNQVAAGSPVRAVEPNISAQLLSVIRATSCSGTVSSEDHLREQGSLPRPLPH